MNYAVTFNLVTIVDRAVYRYTIKSSKGIETTMLVHVLLVVLVK